MRHSPLCVDRNLQACLVLVIIWMMQGINCDWTQSDDFNEVLWRGKNTKMGSDCCKSSTGKHIECTKWMHQTLAIIYPHNLSWFELELFICNPPNHSPDTSKWDNEANEIQADLKCYSFGCTPCNVDNINSKHKMHQKNWNNPKLAKTSL